MTINTSRWLLGTAMAALGLLGLFIAGRTTNEAYYWTGLILVFIGVATIFNLLRIAFDEAEGKERKKNEYLVPLVMVLVAVGSVLFHIISPWWWGPIASNWHYIDFTIDLTFWITGVVFVIIVAFMGYCAYRFRHRDGNEAAYEPENAKLEWGLTIGTAVGVAAMLAPGLFVWDQFVSIPEDATEVEIVGQQWSWGARLPGADGRLGTSDARHVSADNPLGINPQDPAGQDDIVIEVGGDLHLPIDQPVSLALRSLDVLHNFYVPEFRAKMDMVPGQVSQIWLIPTRAGTYEVLCAELCGVGHYLMRGRVVVDEEVAYEAWLQEQRTFAQLLEERRGPSLASNEGDPSEEGEAP